MRKIGKKGKEWIKARKQLIAEAVLNERITIVDGRPFGSCEDCHRAKYLTPDHVVRRSQGGSHDKSNIGWVCLKCHRKRDQQGDPMNKKPKSKKADFAKPHKCINCKQMVSFYLCPYCNKVSIKK